MFFKKTQNKPVETIASMITPTNVEEEKRKFFFDENYNPQFEYAHDIPAGVLTRYGVVSSEYLPFAKRILEKVQSKWKTEKEYLDEIEGPVITKEETYETVMQYLKDLGLEKRMRVVFSYSSIARTSIHGNTMTIRLPIEYRKNSIKGMLYHEIGTHVLRRVNDDTQPWSGQRHVFHLHPYMETEEGLAGLHFQLAFEGYLRLDAIRYMTVYLGNTLSFCELFAALKPYMEDRERRWNSCLRVKRGMKDTSKPGAFTRDQTYFRGEIRVLHWLEEHDFDIAPLYYGKIAIEDVAKVVELNPTYEAVLPTFYSDNPHEYRAKLLEIKKRNGLV